MKQDKKKTKKEGQKNYNSNFTFLHLIFCSHAEEMFKAEKYKLGSI